MAKVFIVNDSALDFSAAERFGELVICTSGRFDRFDLNQMHRELSVELEYSEPEDFILLTSLTTMCVVACSIFVEKHGRLNLLLFRNVEQDYLSRSIVLGKKSSRALLDALTQPIEGNK